MGRDRADAAFHNSGSERCGGYAAPTTRKQHGGSSIGAELSDKQRLTFVCRANNRAARSARDVVGAAPRSIRLSHRPAGRAARHRGAQYGGLDADGSAVDALP